MEFSDERIDEVLADFGGSEAFRGEEPASSAPDESAQQAQENLSDTPAEAPAQTETATESAGRQRDSNGRFSRKDEASETGQSSAPPAAAGAQEGRPAAEPEAQELEPGLLEGQTIPYKRWGPVLTERNEARGKIATMEQELQTLRNLVIQGQQRGEDSPAEADTVESWLDDGQQQAEPAWAQELRTKMHDLEVERAGVELERSVDGLSGQYPDVPRKVMYQAVALGQDPELAALELQQHINGLKARGVPAAAATQAVTGEPADSQAQPAASKAPPRPARRASNSDDHQQEQTQRFMSMSEGKQLDHMVRVAKTKFDWK
jgi:hypothetical protein